MSGARRIEGNTSQKKVFKTGSPSGYRAANKFQSPQNLKIQSSPYGGRQRSLFMQKKTFKSTIANRKPTNLSKPNGILKNGSAAKKMAIKGNSSIGKTYRSNQIVSQ
jgi:hypothetical protein